MAVMLFKLHRELRNSPRKTTVFFFLKKGMPDAFLCIRKSIYLAILEYRETPQMGTPLGITAPTWV
jgi:hypothetical protein